MTADATPDDHELVAEAFPHLAALVRTLNQLDGSVIRVTLTADQIASMITPEHVAAAMQKWERRNSSYWRR